MKKGIRPPYYIKNGDIVIFTLFNDDNIVETPIRHIGAHSEDDSRFTEYYKGRRAGNRDFFRLVENENS